MIPNQLCLTEKHQLISCSVMDFSWMDSIPNVETENILFIAEGLLMYFDVSEVQQLIEQMRFRFPGANLAMDVLNNIGQKLGKKRAKWLN